MARPTAEPPRRSGYVRSGRRWAWRRSATGIRVLQGAKRRPARSDKGRSSGRERRRPASLGRRRLRPVSRVAPSGYFVTPGGRRWGGLVELGLASRSASRAGCSAPRALHFSFWCYRPGAHIRSPSRSTGCLAAKVRPAPRSAELADLAHRGRVRLRRPPHRPTPRTLRSHAAAGEGSVARAEPGSSST